MMLDTSHKLFNAKFGRPELETSALDLNLVDRGYEGGG